MSEINNNNNPLTLYLEGFLGERKSTSESVTDHSLGQSHKRLIIIIHKDYQWCAQNVDFNNQIIAWYWILSMYLTLDYQDRRPAATSNHYNHSGLQWCAGTSTAIDYATNMYHMPVKWLRKNLTEGWMLIGITER